MRHTLVGHKHDKLELTMLPPLAPLITLIYVSSLSHLNAAESSEWRKIYDTLFVAGSAPAGDWSLTEPAQETLTRLRGVLRSNSSKMELPLHEVRVAKLWLVLLDSPAKDCDPDYESTLIFSRMNLLANRSGHLLHGNSAPKDVGLDSIVARKLSTSFEQCSRKVVPRLRAKLKQLSDEIDKIAELYVAYVENLDVCANCADKRLKQQLIDTIELPYKILSYRTLRQNEAIELYEKLYWEKVVTPCHRLIRVNFDMDDNIDDGFADYLSRWTHRLDDAIRSWLQLRRFCLEQKMFLEASRSAFPDFIKQRNVILVD